MIRTLTELREGHFSLKEEDRTLCGVLGEQPGAAGDEAAVPAAGNEGASGLQFPQARQAWQGLREVSSRGVKRAVLNSKITDWLLVGNRLPEGRVESQGLIRRRKVPAAGPDCSGRRGRE